MSQEWARNEPKRWRHPYPALSILARSLSLSLCKCTSCILSRISYFPFRFSSFPSQVSFAKFDVTPMLHAINIFLKFTQTSFYIHRKTWGYIRSSCRFQPRLLFIRFFMYTCWAVLSILPIRAPSIFSSNPPEACLHSPTRHRICLACWANPEVWIKVKDTRQRIHIVFWHEFVFIPSLINHPTFTPEFPLLIIRSVFGFFIIKKSWFWKLQLCQNTAVCICFSPTIFLLMYVDHF